MCYILGPQTRIRDSATRLPPAPLWDHKQPLAWGKLRAFPRSKKLDVRTVEHEGSHDASLGATRSSLVFESLVPRVCSLQARMRKSPIRSKTFTYESTSRMHATCAA